MLRKYRPAVYFVASKEEFDLIEEFNDLFNLIDLYEIADLYGGLEMVFALSRIFFNDEEHIPVEVQNNFSTVNKSFHYTNEFIQKLASYEKEEMDRFGYLLRDDEYCQKIEFDDMGVWVLLYELHNCCSVAVRKNKKSKKLNWWDSVRSTEKTKIKIEGINTRRGGLGSGPPGIHPPPLNNNNVKTRQ